MEQFAIRDKPKEYFEQAAALLYQTSYNLMDFMFRDQQVAIEVLKKLFQKSHGTFSHVFSSGMVDENNKLIAIIIGYTATQAKDDELLGNLNFLLNSPISLWWHITTTVRKVLNQYLIPQTPNSYYVNNLAVDQSLRGQGIGTLMIEQIISKAKLLNCDSIEFDVTKTNEKAVKLYNKLGFKTITTSTLAEDLARKYGLPELIRMGKHI